MKEERKARMAKIKYTPPIAKTVVTTKPGASELAGGLAGAPKLACHTRRRKKKTKAIADLSESIRMSCYGNDIVNLPCCKYCGQREQDRSVPPNTVSSVEQL
jgi:hypothetical protein